MARIRKPNGYWTKERCRDEALKYSTRTEFKNNSGSAYKISTDNNWIEDICSQYSTQGNSHKRFIYAYEFPDNHVYVGLTYNIEIRNTNHNKSGTVYDYTIETGLIPVMKLLIEEPVLAEQASKLEESYLNKYIEDGWYPLNKARPGCLGGGNLKWTFETCKIEALKYQTRTHFKSVSSWAFEVSRKNKWLDEICLHMGEPTKPKGYWSKNKCAEESLRFETIKEFKTESNSAYQISYRNKWLDEICKHMKKNV